MKTNADTLDWLQLIRSENVGPVTLRRLLEFYGTAGNALRMLPDLAKRGGAKRPIVIASRSAVEKELAAAHKLGAQVITLDDKAYPRLLRQIDDAPPVLMTRGDMKLFDKPALAMVGTRNASLNARKFAEKLAADAVAAGFAVVSGLARGIDTCAHTASLPNTIGVLGGGVDVVYPEENTALYNDMAARALVVSEAPLGYQPQTHDFPRRNRIISGMALGVVVVEAAHKSGSLITARMALEQGREVFAVPGSPMDPRCAGTNNLLREGATLVETIADVLRVVQPQWPALASVPGTAENHSGFAEPPALPLDSEIDKARAVVIDLLSPSPCAVDDVIRTSGYTARLVLAVLLELEVAGRLQRVAGGKVCLTA
jgi:DNA processing protein